MSFTALATIQGRVYQLSALEAAEVVAGACGFYDLDVDDDDRGVKIIASGDKRRVTARGKSEEEAVTNLVEMMHGK